MNNIIFLDFDGVLNNARFLMNNTNQWPHFLMVEKIDILNRILDQTNANIVFSTSWRENFTTIQLIDIMEQAGFKHGIRCIGKTPITFECNRALEISEYVSANSVDNYAILDDNANELHGQLKKTVLIDNQTGIMDENIELVLAMLK